MNEDLSNKLAIFFNFIPYLNNFNKYISVNLLNILSYVVYLVFYLLFTPRRNFTETLTIH